MKSWNWKRGMGCVSRLVRLGAKLHPWQEKIIEGADSGKRITIIHARHRHYRCFACRDTGKIDGALGFNGYGPCPLCSMPNAWVAASEFLKNANMEARCD